MAIIQEINNRLEELSKKLSQYEFNIKGVYRGKALGPTGAEAQMYDDELDDLEWRKASVLEEMARLKEAKQALEGNEPDANNRDDDTKAIKPDTFDTGLC